MKLFVCQFFFILIMPCLPFASVYIYSQTIIMNEDFTSYDGTLLNVPANWYISWNSNSSTKSYYTTSASSGISGPNAYKFGIDGATLVTPAFTNADSMYFWIKGYSPDAFSALTVLQSADSLLWDTIVRIDSLPTTGIQKNYPIKLTSTRLMFTYSKSAGNLAFDDFYLTCKKPIAAYTYIANSTSVDFTDLSVADTNAVRWWDFGDGQAYMGNNPTHVYASQGTYTVCLTVTPPGECEDSTCKPIQVLTTSITTNETEKIPQLFMKYYDGMIRITHPQEGKETNKGWIYNSLGQEIKTFTLNDRNTDVYVSSFPAGFYFIVIRTATMQYIQKTFIPK